MLQQDQIVLVDGGLSTELTEVGYVIKNTRLWTGRALFDGEELLEKSHSNFIESGAKIIETASYQLSIDGIMNELACSLDDARLFIQKSVKVAQQARRNSGKTDVLIAGSVGPYGASLCDGSEFSGLYADSLQEEFFIEWHRPRVECLLEENCDLLAFETFPSIKEALAVTKLLAKHPNAKAWLSFSCKDELHLCNGESFKTAYDTFKSNDQLIAIGINCTNPKFISSLLKSVQREEREKPFIVCPNDGSEWDSQSQCYISKFEKDSFVSLIHEWVDHGAKYIGGCCQINSKKLTLMFEKIKEIEKNL